MKFDKIDPTISYGRVKDAEDRFQRIIIELGVREDNYWVGTSMGGNNFQLVTLMNLRHELVNDSRITIEAKPNRILWGSRFLRNAKLINIRHELNAKFPSILEKNKYMALPLQILADHPESLRQGFMKYKAHFPKLAAALEGKSFRYDSSMTHWEMLIAAFVLCQDLASDLDKGKRDNITPIAVALMPMPPEIVLLSVRRYIQIERLINHNLDEHPEFLKVLEKVTKRIN